MKQRSGYLVLIVGMMFPAVAMADGTPMREGLWEITTTMEMPGMPFQPPPAKSRHCYTKEELRDAKKRVPSARGDCTVTDLKYSGKKMVWKVACTGENKGTGEGEMVYQSDSAYEGKMKFDMQEMSMTSRYKARRVGECP